MSELSIPERVAAGDIVNITIEGARVVGLNGAALSYTTQVGGQPFEHEIHIGPGWPGHVVERVAPAEWPPQPGDLWRDGHGILWFASSLPPDDELRMHSASGGRWSIGHVGQLDDNAPWTLVHREGAVS